ncbi:sigma-70 family RNA polymerase sigma factor [Hansschlegelia plantiphila]|uniref:sigma-70 family RNA polymerase sigma factor n=1 Tax=Hansschlegelia plantiphila TaxID=374655 RepID=UPI0022F27C64|nr:sigma-70 family RNA polymerase sigma factor [Hansschlegelia plantiphila]
MRRCCTVTRRWNLDELFRRRAKALTLGLVRRGMSFDTAADVTQDAFLRLATAQRGDEDREDRPDGYLSVVARNLAIDAVRRERVAPFIRGADSDIVGDVAADAPSPERQVSDRQMLARTLAALDELPPRTRRAFELNRLNGMTLAEIGRELGLSTSRAGALVKDAYDHLRTRVFRED